MPYPLVSDRAKRAAKETVEVTAYALANLAFRIHYGRLSRACGLTWPDEELGLIRGTRYFVLGGTIGTLGYIGEVLPLLIQERIQALGRLERAARPPEIEILPHRIDSVSAGCIGAYYLALPEAKRATILSLSQQSYAGGKYPLILLIDIGGTKTEVRLMQVDAAGDIIFDAVMSRRIDTPRNISPYDFYETLAAFVARSAAAIHGSSYEILPFVALGQPGRFENSKAPIGEGTARDLGPSFPGSQPADLFGRALSSVTTIQFDVHVCNDGRAQFCGIVESLRKRDPIQWKKLLGNKLVYLGIGTGLGFGYGGIDGEGTFKLHDLHNAFDVTATDEWEALPGSTFDGVNALARLPFEYSSVVCGKFITEYLHAIELNSPEPLFTPLTGLAQGSPDAVKKALRTFSPTVSPLNAALINRVLEPEILQSKTELLLRLKADELSAILGRTLNNFSRALGHTMVNNIDCQQLIAVVEEIERAKRRSKHVRFIGIGKSHTIGENLAQIFTNLGIPAASFELTGSNCENLTGIAEDDLLFLISNSGESRELLGLFPNLNDKHCVTVAITGDMNSSLSKLCRYRLDSHVEQEAHPNKEAPTTSTTAALAAGTAIAIVASHHLDHNPDEFYIDRPGLRPPAGSRFTGASKNTAFDPVAKISSAYRAFADSIKRIQDDPKFAPALLALARRILVSNKRGDTVFFTGAGGCYFVAKKVAATLTSIGIKAHAINCAQLPHGELGHIRPGNLLVILSFRGETRTLLEVADRAKAKNVELAVITGRRESRLTRKIALRVFAESVIEDQRFVRLPDQTIFASFLNLAVGDALAVVLSYMEPISDQQFATDSHPGGVFGRRESRIDREVLDNLSRDRIKQLMKHERESFAGVLVNIEEEQLRHFLERRNFPESGSPEVMIIGMGSIGLAYLAPLMRSLKKDICFIENVPTRVRAMERVCFKYEILKVDGRSDPLGPRRATVSRISALLLSPGSEDRIASLALRIDQVFTAVGLGSLPELASLFVQMAKFRYVFQIEASLNIVLCENFPVGGDTLSEVRSAITLLLSDEPRELRHYFETHVGLVPAINEAIVPQVEPDFSNPIPVEADRAPLYIDATEWKCGSLQGLPDWPGVQFRKPFDPLHLRKLFVHNMAHAVVGYLAYYAGYTGMAEAVIDPDIRQLVEHSARTVAHSLYQDWRYSDTQHPEEDQYVSCLLDRYNNPELGDQVARVCRDPLRKLEQFDRLIGAINYVVSHALNSDVATLAAELRGILIGVAAAMRYAVETGVSCAGYSDLREQVIARLSLDSRYLEEAERAFEEFRNSYASSSRRNSESSGGGLAT